MAGVISALGPIFKILMEVLSNVFKDLITSPATVEVMEPESGVVVDVDGDDLLDQHGWLLDRGERESGL